MEVSEFLKQIITGKETKAGLSLTFFTFCESTWSPKKNYSKLLQ